MLFLLLPWYPDVQPFARLCREEGLTSLVDGYGFVSFVSGNKGFEPVGQLDETELARVVGAVKGVAHPHLA